MRVFIQVEIDDRLSYEDQIDVCESLRAAPAYTSRYAKTVEIGWPHERWYCGVTETGYSVGSRCNPEEPHPYEPWRCGMIREFIDRRRVVSS